MKIKIFKYVSTNYMEDNVNNWLEQNKDGINILNMNTIFQDPTFIITILYDDLVNKFDHDYWISQDGEKHYPKDMTDTHIINSINMLKKNYNDKCINFKIYNLMQEEIKNRRNR